MYGFICLPKLENGVTRDRPGALINRWAANAVIKTTQLPFTQLIFKKT